MKQKSKKIKIKITETDALKALEAALESKEAFRAWLKRCNADWGMKEINAQGENALYILAKRGTSQAENIEEFLKKAGSLGVHKPLISDALALAAERKGEGIHVVAAITQPVVKGVSFSPEIQTAREARLTLPTHVATGHKWLPIHRAVHQGNTALYPLLLRKEGDANPDILDYPFGALKNTLLHEAVRRLDLPLLHAIFGACAQHEVDISRRNTEGQTAWDLLLRYEPKNDAWWEYAECFLSGIHAYKGKNRVAGSGYAGEPVVLDHYINAMIERCDDKKTEGLALEAIKALTTSLLGNVYAPALKNGHLAFAETLVKQYPSMISVRNPNILIRKQRRGYDRDGDPVTVVEEGDALAWCLYGEPDRCCPDLAKFLIDQGASVKNSGIYTLPEKQKDFPLGDERLKKKVMHYTPLLLFKRVGEYPALGEAIEKVLPDIAAFVLETPERYSVALNQMEYAAGKISANLSPLERVKYARNETLLSQLKEEIAKQRQERGEMLPQGEVGVKVFEVAVVKKAWEEETEEEEAVASRQLQREMSRTLLGKAGKSFRNPSHRLTTRPKEGPEGEQGPKLQKVITQWARLSSSREKPPQFASDPMLPPLSNSPGTSPLASPKTARSDPGQENFPHPDTIAAPQENTTVSFKDIIDLYRDIRARRRKHSDTISVFSFSYDISAPIQYSAFKETISPLVGSAVSRVNFYEAQRGTYKIYEITLASQTLTKEQKQDWKEFCRKINVAVREKKSGASKAKTSGEVTTGSTPDITDEATVAPFRSRRVFIPRSEASPDIVTSDVTTTAAKEDPPLISGEEMQVGSLPSPLPPRLQQIAPDLARIVNRSCKIKVINKDPNRVMDPVKKAYIFFYRESASETINFQKTVDAALGEATTATTIAPQEVEDKQKECGASIQYTVTYDFTPNNAKRDEEWGKFCQAMDGSIEAKKRIKLQSGDWKKLSREREQEAKGEQPSQGQKEQTKAQKRLEEKKKQQPGMQL